MTIFVEDKLKPGVVGTNLADAVDIETTGPSNVQADLNTNSTDITTIENTLRQSNSAGIAWQYDTQITADPPENFFRFNNVDPEQATELYVDVFSVSGRFDEFLTQFGTGGFVYLQDRTNTRNSFLYETSGAITLTGGSTGYYTIPVTFRRSQSVLAATQGDVFTFIFLPTGTSQGGGGSLPNMFLNEITEGTTNLYTRKIDTEAVVRFWLRENTVDPGEENTTDIGLIISEANGDLPENGDTYQINSDDTNVLIYLSLDDTFAGATDLNTVWLVVTRDQGQEDESNPYIVNVGMNFTERTNLVASGTVYESTTGFDGNGPRFHYRANDIIELYFQDTDQFFTISEANAPNVDLTRSVKTLTESQTDLDFQSKLNYQHGIPSNDQFKLDQLVETASTSSSSVIAGVEQILYKSGSFSNDSGDYFTSDFDTGLPPNLGSSAQTWLVAVPHEYTINGAQGLESGAANATEIKRDLVIDGFTDTVNIYTIPLPTTASLTNSFVLVGTTESITEIDPTSLIKVDRDNIQPSFLALIENNQSINNEGERLTALENKVSVLYPLAPDVDSLTNWGDIYVPQRATEAVVLTDGNDLVADYRGDATRYESAGVTYDNTPANVVEYTGLSGSLRRIFGFRVSAPSDLTLLSVIDGAEIIPLIDVTAAGNYRVNNYTSSETAGQPVSNQVTFLSAVDDDNLISTAANDNARFIIPDFPAGATDTSRSVSVGFNVLVNGVDTLAEHLATVNVPETNVAQDRVQITFTANLGPLHSYRQVTATVDYRFVVSTDYRIIFTMVSGPSDVTFRVRDLSLIRNYTPAATVTRTDNFQILEDFGSNYTFTGENELLVAFHPYPSSNVMNVVPAAVVTSTGVVTELNDQPAPVPSAGFEDVRIPDTIQFRTVRPDHILNHSDLSTLLADRNVQWAYGLARLRTVSTEHAVTEAIDLAAGSSINGVAFDAGRTTQNAQAFTPASAVTVTLPASTTLSDFIIMEVTWHTGVGTATDNNNRNYTEMGFVPAIINATDDELILGGRGRGADNYGIEVDTSTIAGTDTTVLLTIINFNDTAGATLPAGSLITGVRFY